MPSPQDLKHSGRMGHDTQLPESGEKLEVRSAFVSACCEGTGCGLTVSFLGAKAKRGHTLHCSVSTAAPVSRKPGTQEEHSFLFRRPERLSAVAPGNGFLELFQAAAEGCTVPWRGHWLGHLGHVIPVGIGLLGGLSQFSHLETGGASCHVRAAGEALARGRGMRLAAWP